VVLSQGHVDVVDVAVNGTALEESVRLDMPWLGLAVRIPVGRVNGDSVRLDLQSVEGPGNFHAYVTNTFGDPEQYVHGGRDR
jgi:hypothetical protein